MLPHQNLNVHNVWVEIAVIVDSSRELGAGHIMRCLALAEAIAAEHKIKAKFYCQNLPGRITNVIIDRGFLVENCPEAVAKLAGLASVYIVDRKDAKVEWERVLHSTGRVVVLDDVPSTSHDADVLINGNPFGLNENPYRDLVNADCQLMLGPQYNLFSDDLFAAADTAAIPRTKIKRILICFGGTDPRADTPRALSELGMIDEFSGDVTIDVVVGPGSLGADWVPGLVEILPSVKIHLAPRNLAQLLASADLAIGAGGCMLWERALVGLPSIVVAAAENQVRISRIAQDAGACTFLGRSAEVQTGQIADSVKEILDSPKRLQRMSVKAREMMKDCTRATKHEMIGAVIGR